MRTIIWFIYFWLYMLAIYPQQKYFEKRRKAGVPAEEDFARINKLARNWAARLLKLAGVSCHARGLENIPQGQPVLFASNHQGNFDIPLMLTQLDKIYPIVAKKDLENLPFISSWMKLFGCLFLDRGNPRDSLKVFAEAEKLLKQGASVVIFPEGTRSKQDEAGEFKEGAFKIALRAGVPVVPVAIDGSYRAMEAHGFWIHPAETRVTILPPIQTEGMGKEEARHLGAHVREMIMECNREKQGAESR